MLPYFIRQVISKQGDVTIETASIESILNILDALLHWWMKRSLLSAHKPWRQACSLIIKAPLQLPLTPTRPAATTPLSPLKRESTKNLFKSHSAAA